MSQPQMAPYTRAERIRDLVTIDADIASILRAASIALSDLTPSTNTVLPAPSLETSQENFEKHTLAYYNQIQSVSARLRRQVYALEEAGIIAAEPEVQNTPAPIPSQQPPLGRQLPPGAAAAAAAAAQKAAESVMPITNGGLGTLDVGWLNSRRDVVGKMKEAELWHEARLMAEQMSGQKQVNGHSQEEDVHMEDGQADSDSEEGEDVSNIQ